MAMVAQLLPTSVLSRLSETELSLVISAVDNEILKNARIKSVLSARVKEVLRTINAQKRSPKGR